MNQVKELRKELGSRYVFEQFLSEREVRQLQKQASARIDMQTVCSLTAGCLKIEAVLYKSNGQLQLGYDVFVKDEPDASEWICYDSPTDVVNLKEFAMLAVLDRVVKEKDLSYTECRFERIDGKIVKKDERTDADTAV